MEEKDFDGTIVLERLAEIGERESFFDAVDSDDFRKAASLMRRAGVDDTTIKLVLEKMEAADGNH